MYYSLVLTKFQYIVICRFKVSGVYAKFFIYIYRFRNFVIVRNVSWGKQLLNNVKKRN